MPLYEYRAQGKACDHCRDGFEILQAFADPPLTACPECGQPCERVISAPNYKMSTSDILAPSNLASKGFTQYRKTRPGEYKKTAGDGPDTLKR
jgi:putative FmdB family regulatory protein